MEVFSSVTRKIMEWLVYNLLAISLYKLTMKIRSYYALLLSTKTKSSTNTTSFPILSKTHVENFGFGDNSKTIVCDINGGFLRSCVSSPSSSFFPFFMLVAFEGGSIVRAFILLLSYPLTCIITNQEVKLRIMIFITFFGLRVKDMEIVGKGVLPKFYLEDLNPLVYEMWALAKGKIVITSVPRVMVEWFAKEYLGAEHVIGSELQTLGGKNGNFVFSGFIKSSGLVLKHKALKEHFGDTITDVCIGVSFNTQDQLFMSHCKEGFVVSKDTLPNTKLPRSKYPKPLIFHDGRLAFLPTPAATAFMFVFLPVAIPLSIFRVVIGYFLPPQISHPLQNLIGGRLTLLSDEHNNHDHNHNHKHVLYVANHRTLYDPIMLGIVLRKRLTAVTYSLSRFSELLAPIPTARLTRDRARDAMTMRLLLEKGDLVVCPEGTTCREPYLLRFSSLFAELTDEIVPVAVETDVSMFYGTTASGFKWLDPIFFLMNPRPSYTIRVLKNVAPENTCGAGGKTSVEVANRVQEEIGRVLGFECTHFTRKDKYLMLAGNEGFAGH